MAVAAAAMEHAAVETEEELMWQVQSGTHNLILLRGPPGCGKSTFAMNWVSQRLGKSVESLRENRALALAHICSMDDFEEVPDDSGENGSNCGSDAVQDRHSLNGRRVEIAMRLGITPLVVDDANMRLLDMKQYADAAIKFDYAVTVVHPVTFNTNWNSFPPRVKLGITSEQMVPMEREMNSFGDFEAFNGYFDYFDRPESCGIFREESRQSVDIPALGILSSCAAAVELVSSGISAATRFKRHAARFRRHDAGSNAESDGRDEELWRNIVNRAAERAGTPENKFRDVNSVEAGHALPTHATDSLVTLSFEKVGSRRPGKPCRRKTLNLDLLKLRRSGPKQTVHRYQSLRDLCAPEHVREISALKQPAWSFPKACGGFVHRARNPALSSGVRVSTVAAPPPCCCGCAAYFGIVCAERFRHWKLHVFSLFCCCQNRLLDVRKHTILRGKSAKKGCTSTSCFRS